MIDTATIECVDEFLSRFIVGAGVDLTRTAKTHLLARKLQIPTM